MQTKKLQLGISYLEIMIAVVLIALFLVPLMRSLEVGIAVNQANSETTLLHYHLQEKVELVLTEEFDRLRIIAGNANSPSVATTYSDIPGSQNRRLVFLSFYDVDNTDGDNNRFTIFDPNTDIDNNPYTGEDVDIDLLWLKVEIENQDLYLQTLVAAP